MEEALEGLSYHQRLLLRQRRCWLFRVVLWAWHLKASLIAHMRRTAITMSVLRDNCHLLRAGFLLWHNVASAKEE